ncbi:formylglycine-generating enzyme family protein [Robiginitomaculum antarcticum]|uniref:formylglycine-generating enzyme family protein n=1 Tax=Robiginitomaculum antarcticum TaxID=437507 RepID=UPI0014616197|nr:formylglycine-generating enzyme family protein [Robiginitomaculum antarcticum]
MGKISTTVQIEGARTIIGSNMFYPEERERSVQFSSFDIDTTEVTNQMFTKFVSETGYVTTAEKPQAGFNTAGGAVFKQPTAKNLNWWQFVEGANWRAPEGPGSSIKDRGFEPVVQVSFEDAQAYAKWKGRDLPSEGQWEFAARANDTTEFVWGDERAPEGQEMANSWQGAFPIQNTLKDGYQLRAPVGCYPPNDYGLYDMIGNVWEWTKTPYSPQDQNPVYAIKGGSFLCAPNFCARYRAPARQPQEGDFSTNHIGFRTVSKEVSN